MSNRSVVMRAALVALAALSAVALVPAWGAAQAGPQPPAAPVAVSLPEARAKVTAYRDSLQLATKAYRAARGEITAALTDTLRVGRRRVAVAPDALSAADRATLVAALEATDQELEARFGASSAALVDTVPWQVVLRPRGQSVSISARSGEGSTAAPLGLPLNAMSVQRFALARAGGQLRQLHPSLSAFVRADIALGEDSLALRLARRSLALGASTVGRRCAAGGTVACKAVMTDARGEAAKSLWYASDDPKISVRYPFSAQVRASLVSHAITAAGPDALVRLQSAPPDASALEVLARVAASTPEGLLQGWTEAMLAVPPNVGAPLGPITVSTLAWCGLLFALVIRRRPR